MSDGSHIEDWVVRISKIPIDNDFELDHILDHSGVPLLSELDIFAIGAKLSELGYAIWKPPFTEKLQDIIKS